MKKKWEYLKVEVEEHLDKTYNPIVCWASAERLNKLGSEGWELVCAFTELSGEGPFLLFKRPLEE